VRTVYEVNVKKVRPQRIAGLTTHVTMPTIGNDVSRGLGNLFQALNGATPSGPPFVVYERLADGAPEGDVLVCVPIKGDVPVSNEVRELEVPGGQVASTIHRGRYQDIGSAYASITRWMQEHHRHPSGPPREIYLTDPASGRSDEALTEIQFPIR
jgi:effector-binding domain-containing protein